MNRSVRRGWIGVQRYLTEEACSGNGNRISSYRCTVTMHVTAVRITLLFGTASALMLFNLIGTLDKPCVLRKTEYRLRKEDQNRAEAQGKKPIIAGCCHASPSTSGSQCCQTHADITWPSNRLSLPCLVTLESHRGSCEPRRGWLESCIRSPVECPSSIQREASLTSLDDQLSYHRRMHQAGISEGAAFGWADRNRQQLT